MDALKAFRTLHFGSEYIRILGNKIFLQRIFKITI